MCKIFKKLRSIFYPDNEKPLEITPGSDSDNKKSPKTISDDELQEAFRFQKDDANWTFYNEREFLENELQSRFNFLMTVYALFVAALFTARSQESKFAILIVGGVLLLMMGCFVYRSYTKLNVVARILHKLDNRHVLPIISAIKKMSFPGGNIFIGIIIPLVVVLSFVAGLFLLKEKIFCFQ